MITITKVVVGSRLHGLDTPESDIDIRGIYMHDLADKLSPFKVLKNTQWIEGDIDNTSYELASFCKEAVKGNATILEIFFSDMIMESTSVADEMRTNWVKFMDTDKFVEASRGYAANQYKKMQLFDPDKRTPKFAVAYVRVLWQCSEFLRTGVFPVRITEEPIRDFLMLVKNDFDEKYIPPLTNLFVEMQKRVTDNHATTTHRHTPDIPWIEDFIYRAYTEPDV